MRIVAGKWRGRRLAAPPGPGTRPTADRLREAVFNMLAARDLIVGRTVLDAFAGSGALAFEALSRGAARATLFETDPKALQVIEASAAALGASAATVRRCDATKPGPAAAAHDLVFLDPPYRAGLVPKALAALAAGGWVGEAAALAVETGADEADIAWPFAVDIAAEKVSGTTRIVLATRS